jgi:hypothetical protein
VNKTYKKNYRLKVVVSIYKSSYLGDGGWRAAVQDYLEKSSRSQLKSTHKVKQWAWFKQ